MKSIFLSAIQRDRLNTHIQTFGWVSRVRNLGGLLFVDLKDRTGILQLIIDPKNLPEAKKLGLQDCLAVAGVVQERPKNQKNPKIPTGEVELVVDKLTVLAKSKVPPFVIEDDVKASEELRLHYRYLDLRRESLQHNIIFRHKVVTAIREYLNNQDFIEIETPLLTRSMPEGARDYLVPSRLYPGKFYALAQSPQIYKQLLMVAGFERYYQIARCLRDEDPRHDRQPEHTQIDIEISFVSEEDIYRLIEGMFQYIFKKALDKDLKIPFPRLSYKEAIEEYGTDKPDLSSGNDRFHLLWVYDFPLFEQDERTGRIVPCHHIFTQPKEEDINYLDSKPLRVRGRQYDLVCDGNELGSGSIRNHNRHLQEKLFEIIGVNKETAEKRFGLLLDALEYGAPPHGGIALGIDRIVMILRGLNSLRDVMAFPKTTQAQGLLENIPDLVEPEQLKELHIKIEE